MWQTVQTRPLDSPRPSPTVTASIPATLTPTAHTSPTPTLTPQPTPTFDVASAGAIAAEVAEARRALPRWGTPLTLVSTHDLTVALYRRYQNTPPLPLRMRLTLQALRLWSWDEIEIDPRAQTRQCAAIYVPETEELYLRRNWVGDRDVLEAHLAYGYARAIPDQMGDLQYLRNEATSLDRELALTAVADGDALVALWLYKGVTPGSLQAEALTDLIAEAHTPGWGTDAPLLDKLSRLSLDIGADFATARYTQGGTAALDAAVLRPPRSTEQLLHPERYTEDDVPETVAPIEVDLGEGWTLTHTETLGEAMLGVVIETWSHGYAQAEAVANWGGDHLQIWQGPEGQEAALLHTTWDTTKDAVRFYGVLADLMPRILVPGVITDTTPAARLPRGRWWAGGQGAVFLYRRFDHVYLVWGTDVTVVENIGATLREVNTNE